MNRQAAAGSVCAIIPCYNEAGTIGRIVRLARPHVADILVVDDCSADDTAAAARAAGARVLRHRKNLGKGAALKTGFAAAAGLGFKAAVTLDGDGQHDTTEIPLFLEAYAHGDCDIVLGNRMTDTRTMPWSRRLANCFTSWAISRMVGVSMQDTQCGFRLIGLDFWRAVCLDSCRFDLESEILIKACRAGGRIREVCVRTIYFSTNRSKISPLPDAVRFFQVLWRCHNA